MKFNYEYVNTIGKYPEAVCNRNCQDEDEETIRESVIELTDAIIKGDLEVDFKSELFQQIWKEINDPINLYYNKLNPGFKTDAAKTIIHYIMQLKLLLLIIDRHHKDKNNPILEKQELEKVYNKINFFKEKIINYIMTPDYAIAPEDQRMIKKSKDDLFLLSAAFVFTISFFVYLNISEGDFTFSPSSLYLFFTTVIASSLVGYFTVVQYKDYRVQKLLNYDPTSDKGNNEQAKKNFEIIFPNILDLEQEKNRNDVEEKEQSDLNEKFSQPTSISTNLQHRKGWKSDENNVNQEEKNLKKPSVPSIYPHPNSVHYP